MYDESACQFVDGETILSEEGTTQGDPLAMVFYAIATLPMIARCKVEELLGEEWFADDATGAGGVIDLRTWWDRLNTEGPKFGYFPNGEKTWLVVKEKHYDDALNAFSGTKVRVTTHGRRLLGAALGMRAFADEFVAAKVRELELELQALARIATTQPQAAYSALSQGVAGKWLYLARTIPEAGQHLQPLEDSLHQRLLPAITGRDPAGDLERDILALPARHGGMGISKPPQVAILQHQSSMSLTANLVRSLTSKLDIPEGAVPTQKSKAEIHKELRNKTQISASELHKRLPEKLQYARLLACEKGASSWLTTSPLAVHGFALPKGTFRDALCLRYGWPVVELPTTCVCGSAFEVDHALSCRFGGLPIRRHNEVRNLLASCLRKIGCDTTVEPQLQRLSGEVFHRHTTTTDQEARLDIKSSGFWGEGSEEAFFDVRVFNPFAASYRSLPIPSTYRRHEKEKSDCYEERVREVERGAFTPLVFAATGGAGRLAAAFLKRLATLLAERSGDEYSTTIAWLRARLAFSLLRSAVACLRSSRRKAAVDCEELQPLLAVSQARIPATER